MQMTGMTPQALRGQMVPEAETRIRTRLTLEAIAAAENLTADDNEIEDELKKMAEMYHMELDKIKEMIGDAEKTQIAMDIAVGKAVDWIVKEAVESKPAEKEE